MSLLSSLHHHPKAIFSLLYPLVIGGKEVGWMSQERRDILMGMDDLFRRSEGDGVALKGHDRSATDILGEATSRLIDAGIVRQFEPELFPVSSTIGEEPLALIDRCASTFLGTFGPGVHLNGYCFRDGEMHIWFGKRAASLTHYPSLLDNLSAGGWPHGQTARDIMIQEADEEARIPPELLTAMHQAGQVSYDLETKNGIRRETLQCFDVELPEDFQPVNQDGLVDSFLCLPIQEVISHLRSGAEDYKYNCCYVVIDFLIRHGLVSADTDPDYEDLQPALISRRQHKWL